MRTPVKVECIIFRKINNNYDFLLLERIKSKSGFWQPVTGGVEEGESIEDAVFREVLEETSIRKEDIIRIFRDVYYFELKSDFFEKNIIKEFVFGFEVKSNVNVHIDAGEHDKFKWVNFDKAIKLLKYETNKNAFEKMKKILKI